MRYITNVLCTQRNRPFWVLGRLIRRLTAGMSDAELARIRGILERAKADLASK